MKNLKRVLLVLCLAAILLVGAVFTVIANTGTPEYTGSMEELIALVGKLEEQTGAETPDYTKIESAAKAIAEYITETPVDPASEGYGEAMAKAYAAAVMCADRRITFEADATLETKKSGLISADNIIALFPDIDTSDEKYIAYANKAKPVAIEVVDADFTAAQDESKALEDAYSALSEAKFLIDFHGLGDKEASFNGVLKAVVDRACADASAALVKGSDDLWTTADAGAVRKALSVFYGKNPVYTEAEGAEAVRQSIETAIEALKSEIEQKVDENLYTLDDLNVMSAYNIGFGINEDFSRSDAGFVLKNKAMYGGTFTTELYNGSVFKIEQDETGNKYLLMTTGSNAGGSYIYYHLSKLEGDPNVNGFVIEFKIKGTGSNPAFFDVSAGGYGTGTGRFFPKSYMGILPNGELYEGTYKNSYEKSLISGMLACDVWTHVMIRFEPDDFTIHLYCDGQFIDSFDAKYNGNRFDFATADGHGMRLSIRGETGSVCIDDLAVYAGSGYRNPTKLTAMDDAEKFIYYTDYSRDERRTPTDKETAYNRAGDLLSKFYNSESKEYLTDNEAVIAAVDEYISIDADKIKKDVDDYNRDTFISMVNGLSAVERTVKNIEDRTREFNKIETFLSENSGRITDDDAYKAANEIYSELTRQVKTDNYTIEFTRAMDIFEMLDALAGKRKWFEKAKALAEAEPYALDESVYEELKELGTFTDFVSAYEVYKGAAEIVGQMERDEEAKKIVECVNFIKDYTDEESWIANYDYINRYVLIIRKSVREGKYNKDYPGLTEALVILEPIEDWFYGKLQEVHAGILRSTLDEIEKSEAYIEKLGLCSYIERYLIQNDVDIDRSDEVISALLVEYDTHRKELTYREQDYVDLLKQNSHYFISYVDTMVLSDNYTTIKENFIQANTFYFSLDASVDGVGERIAIFDEYSKYIDLAEESSSLFKMNVAALEVIMDNATSDDDEIYWALADCYKLLEYIETDIDGVKEALEKYTVIAAEYLAEIDDKNSELYSAVSMMGSLRAGSGISPIISVAMKFIFG